MCVQIDIIFKCGHRVFRQIDRCDWLGVTCLGPSGEHAEEPVSYICDDCVTRKQYRAIQAAQARAALAAAAAGPSNATAGSSYTTAGSSYTTAGPSYTTAGPSRATVRQSKAIAEPSRATARQSKATAGPSKAIARPSKAIAGSSKTTGGLSKAKQAPQQVPPAAELTELSMKWWKAPGTIV